MDLNILKIMVLGSVNIDWLLENLVFPFLLLLLPAIISHIVSKKQVESAAVNLNKQIDAEVKKVETQYRNELEKVKLEYEYQQKRDNTNFLMKIRIEEAKKLISSLIYLRDNVQMYGIYIAKGDRNDEKYKEFMRRFSEEENAATIYANFFPNQKKEILDTLKNINVATEPLFVLFSKGQTLDENTFDEIGFKTFEVSSDFYDLTRKIADEVEKQIQKLER